MSDMYGTIWYTTPTGVLVEQSGIPVPTVPEGCTAVDPNVYWAAVAAAEAAEAAQAEADRVAAAEREALVQQAVDYYLAAQAELWSPPPAGAPLAGDNVVVSDN